MHSLLNFETEQMVDSLISAHHSYGQWLRTRKLGGPQDKISQYRLSESHLCLHVGTGVSTVSVLSRSRRNDEKVLNSNMNRPGSRSCQLN